MKELKKINKVKNNSKKCNKDTSSDYDSSSEDYFNGNRIKLRLISPSPKKRTHSFLYRPSSSEDSEDSTSKTSRNKSFRHSSSFRTTRIKYIKNRHKRSKYFSKRSDFISESPNFKTLPSTSRGYYKRPFNMKNRFYKYMAPGVKLQDHKNFADTENYLFKLSSNFKRSPYKQSLARGDFSSELSTYIKADFRRMPGYTEVTLHI